MTPDEWLIRRYVHEAEMLRREPWTMAGRVYVQPMIALQLPPMGQDARWPEPYDDIEEWDD